MSKNIGISWVIGLLVVAISSACDDENKTTNDDTGSSNPSDSSGVSSGALNRSGLIVSICGNGTVEGDEECDSGGSNSDTTIGACKTDCSGLVASEIVYVDANPQNTQIAEAGLENDVFYYETDNTNARLWRYRTGFGFDANGNAGVYEKDRKQHNKGDGYQLKTTIDGLTPGRSYGISVCYMDADNEYWQLQAGLSPDSLTAFIETRPHARVTNLGLSSVGGSNREQLVGFIGNATADSKGQIHVYIDDFDDDQFNGRRSWYEGVAYGAPRDFHDSPNNEAIKIATDGVWSWFNEPTAQFVGDNLYVGYVKYLSRQMSVARYDVHSDNVYEMQLSTKSSYSHDDHDVPAIALLPDNRLLAVYARHGKDQHFFYRRTLATDPPSSTGDWEEQQTHTVASNKNVTYSNVYYLADEQKLYNFFRGPDYNPHWVVSTDNGGTWSEATKLIKTGSGSTRPYLRYASDRQGRIDMIYTDGHPRDVANSLYHMYYENGRLYKTDGTPLKALADAPLNHDNNERGTVIYQYSNTALTGEQTADDWIPSGRAWSWDLHYATDNDTETRHPVAAFSVQLDNAGGGGNSDRIYYYYAKWTGTAWEKHLIAQAGAPLYSAEDDYAGGITIDPKNTNVVYISSNAANPFDLSSFVNIPLSTSGRYELYRGVTEDGGTTFVWEAVTSDSSGDNLRPIVPENHAYERSLVWFHGTYSTYMRYATDVYGLFINGREPIPIINPDFEDDTAVVSPPTGWVAEAPGTMYVTAGSGLSNVDPTSAFSGANFVTANRLAPDPDDTFPEAAQTMRIYQKVDVSSLASSIDTGNRYVELTFTYNDVDSGDLGVVAISFFDSQDTRIGMDAVFYTDSKPTKTRDWETASLYGKVPVGTRAIQFSLAGESVGTGTARNVSFDNLSADLVPKPDFPVNDVIHANMIQFADNGAWCWYQDERAIVDTEEKNLVVGYIANHGGVDGTNVDGNVMTTHFDLATGSRTRFFHKQVKSYSHGDDHNVPALLKKSDGDVLIFYAGHNQVNDGANNHDRSFYSTFDVDSGEWSTPPSEFDWGDYIPDNAPGNDSGTTYSNLFQLSAEDPNDDGHGRLYNIARTKQSPHIMYSDDNGATWEYGGQLTKQASSSPSSSYVNGYYKYASNGVDRIDLFATEFHPRDYNTSLYHAYIKDGKLYNSIDEEIDNDIFDVTDSFDADKITSTDDFTQVFQAGTDANSRAWNSDFQIYDDGTIVGLFKARAGAFNQDHNVGDDDHRIWYARFDPNTKEWTSTEIAKAGGLLFTAGSESDYTGLGALHPNKPDTLYISTEIDPRTDIALAHHEIFKGVTSDHGLTWTWTAITKNSSYDNLRPIIPSWDENKTALLWWRGTMVSSQSYDTTVVGIIDCDSEQQGKLHYVDATAENTSRADGGEFTFTGPSSNAGDADDSWHARSGIGNNESVFTTDESGAEDAPTLKTEISDMQAGTYNVFVFFWAETTQDWRIRAGLAPDDLMLYRKRGAQQALAADFETSPVVSDGTRSLYRAYLGRVGLSANETITVFIGDSEGESLRSVWYDGIGYAPVQGSCFAD